jgi:hypothetical protein
MAEQVLDVNYCERIGRSVRQSDANAGADASEDKNS